MKKIQFIFLMLLFCSLPLFGCTFGVKVETNNQYGNEESIVQLKAKPRNTTLIASKYILGDEFTAPTVKLPYEGKEYEAKAYIKFPDGKISDAKTVVLNEPGKYEVTYLAECGEKMLTDVYEFVVTNELYSVTGKDSKVYYGTHEYMPDTKGIITSIRPSDSFTYNKPIDLSSYTRNNEILTLNVLPKTIGTVDAQKIIVRLTDIYDPENFITIEMKKVDDNKLAWAENATYVVAYGNGQDACGLEEGSHLNTGRVVDYNGKKYTIHKNNIYGAHTAFSMPGAPKYQNVNLPYYDPQYVGEQEFSFAMDYAKGVIYAGPKLSLINDLRSDIIYGSNFWNGFTTGEVFLSISATGYKADSLNLIIKEIAGQSTETMTENLYEDTEAPSLEILWDEDYPTALVGHKYPIFPVYSYDQYDREEKEVKTTVYLNYGLENEVIIPVVDNSFVPQYATKYYIHFEVSDKCGNVNEKVITVNASNNVDKIEIDQMTTVDDTFDVGTVVTVKDLTYKNVKGNLIETVTAVLKSDSSISYEVIDNKFTPLYAGEYEIKYEYSDFMFNDVYSYNVVVNHSNKPVIDANITLSKYYIKGCEYTLPSYTGYVFENGKPVEKPLEIFVKEGDNVVKITDNKYIPNYNGEITVIYSLKSGLEETTKEISATAVNVGYDSTLEMGKYFIGDNFDIIAESKYIEYKFIENKDTTLDFINALASNNVTIRFGASEGLDNFQKIHVYLTDASDESIKVRFTYEKESSGFVKFYVNDGAAANYQSYFASNDNPIIFEYNNNLKQVSPHPASFQLITETVYGEKFNGFISDRVYLSIEVEGLSGPSALRITNLCGQPFTKVKADIIEPKVYVTNDVGDYDINTIYTLNKAGIGDVLDPNFKAFIRVKDPEGNIVTSINGILLDENASYNVEYQFKLEKFGIYQVYYEAVDTNENKASYTFVINVVDKEVPIVTILNPVTEGKVGEAINVASISVKDNYSEKFNIYVCLVDPDGISYSLTRVEIDNTIINKSFTTSVAGDYQIYYYVSDEAGNVTIVSYMINVK